MAPNSDANIWSLMNYIPPRGPCNHKEGMLSSKCPCQRFMIHPLKAASSFECDGCSHHASYHSMENKNEEEIIKRWKAQQQETDKESAATGAPSRSSKRRRIESAPTSNTASAASTAEGQVSRMSGLSIPGGMWALASGIVGGADEDVRAVEIVGVSSRQRRKPGS